MISLAVWLVAFVMVTAAAYALTRDLITAVSLALVAYLFAGAASWVAELLEVVLL